MSRDDAMPDDILPPVPLKPCPFCGSAIVGPLLESTDQNDRLGVVGCGCCGCSGPSHFDAAEFVARWNQRATPPPDQVDPDERVQAAVWETRRQTALECCEIVEQSLVVHGDQYGSFGAPSNDAKELASIIKVRFALEEQR